MVISVSTLPSLNMFGSEFYRITIDLSSSKPKKNSFATSSSDYRFSEISILGYDIPTMALDSVSSLEPLKAKLLGNGIIHLFREFSPDDAIDNNLAAATHLGDDTMLSILAVPTYYTASDILGFIGDYYMENLTHLRILKSERPNRFLVLLKFKDAVKAAEFQYHYDGKPFNAMEPEVCHVVFVNSVTIEADEPDVANGQIPFLLRDPFTSFRLSFEDVLLSPDAPVDSEDILSSNQAVQVELPTCPVCLERLDYDISGLLTIPCQHTFHCMCLSKWRDDTCPVCRYTNDASNHSIRRSVRRLLQLNLRMQQLQVQEEGYLLPLTEGMSLAETCMACSALEHLWVCLICGNVGCSRYAPEQHSIKHFVETGHCFAMEISTSRVWDYAGDKYVHRLVASETDGKIVELPEKESSSSKTHMKEEDSEYSELLLLQLISQREYYELLLNEKGLGGKRLRRGLSFHDNLVASKHIGELESKVKELSASVDKMNQSVIPAFKKKIDMLVISSKLAADELIESNALNEGLSAKIDYLTEENKNLKATNEDLSEQVKDLMFFLEAQEKFKDQPDDVREGTLVMKKKPTTKKKRK